MSYSWRYPLLAVLLFLLFLSYIEFSNIIAFKRGNKQGIYFYGLRNESRIALTFDDGPVHAHRIY